MNKGQAMEVMRRPRKANGFGKDAWYYVNKSTIDVYCDPPAPGHTPQVRLTRTQLEYALNLMRAAQGKGESQ